MSGMSENYGITVRHRVQSPGITYAQTQCIHNWLLLGWKNIIVKLSKYINISFINRDKNWSWASYMHDVLCTKTFIWICWIIFELHPGNSQQATCSAVKYASWCSREQDKRLAATSSAKSNCSADGKGKKSFAGILDFVDIIIFM